MEKIKTVLDRERVSSDEIRSRQDLERVLHGAGAKTPLWKSGWFYGTVGLASIAIVFGTINLSTATDIKSESPPKVMAAGFDLMPQDVQKTTVTVADQSETAVKPIDIREKESTTEKEKVEKVEKPNPVQQDISREKPAEEVTPPEIQKTVDQSSIRNPESIAKVNGVVNKMPNIAGVFYGPIAIDKLCSENRITSSPDIEITSFKINYSVGNGDVVRAVTGDVIPADICAQIRRWSLNSTVFITEIRGVSSHGEAFMLSSMSLIPTK